MPINLEITPNREYHSLTASQIGPVLKDMFDDVWRRLRETVTPKMSVRLLQVTLDSAERLGLDRA